MCVIQVYTFHFSVFRCCFVYAIVMFPRIAAVGEIAQVCPTFSLYFPGQQTHTACSPICLRLVCQQAEPLLRARGRTASSGGWPPSSSQVKSCGICGEQNGIGQVFSKYFCFPCQSSHQVLHTHHRLSGADTIDHTVADVPIVLSLTPTRETTNKILDTQLTRSD
jgi:hypothetical protein